jgi:hypothetical protein
MSESAQPTPEFAVGDMLERKDGFCSFQVTQVMWVDGEQEYFYLQSGFGAISIAHRGSMVRKRSDA